MRRSHDGHLEAPEPRAMTHPPIPSSYDWKRDAAGWMKKTFNDPASLQSVMISDPIVFDYPSSPATWLVCIELDVRDRTGSYMGPKRFALGFQTSRASPDAKTSVNFIEPGSQQRIDHFVCDREDISLKPWADWEKSYHPK